MTKTFTTSLFFTAATAALLGAGCGDDTAAAGDADFAAASTELRTLAMESAIGLRPAEAYLALLQAEIDAELTQGQCPERTYGERSMTIVGNGCETLDGTRYEGRAHADNAFTFRDLFAEEPNVDPAKPMKLEFEQFVITAADQQLSIHGQLEQSSPEAARYTAGWQLTVEKQGHRILEHVTTDCRATDDGRTCTFTGGVVEIDGLGSFYLAGTVTHGEQMSGAVELRGKQVLRLDLNTLANDCYAYTIDGAPAGTFCAPEGEDPTDPGEGEGEEPWRPAQVIGYGLGCGSGEIDASAYVGFEADAVRFELLGPDMSAPLVVDLADPTLEGDGSYSWRAVASLSGVAYQCDQSLEAQVRVIAEADGVRVCEVYGDGPSRFPGACADW